ncbi:hypothetical protein [Sporosarcina globispora]|uniref:hypothetical protein n=1 Tax=Sporosarcina globispora TaxID=1459 RepID=UPI00128EC817|nr:hypothetical protein [Sporosarcina globispora]
MRANIPDELIKAINEKIYLDLELHILQKKLTEANDQGKEGFAEYLNKVILKVISQRRSNNEYLRKHGVKVREPEELDDMFVRYYYSVQSDLGGYKEGYEQFWKSAMTYNLRKRMNKYFNFKGG